ncbi:hypothetical protein J6590_023142 [Homalodisca vitripennis]|nr:hypothetical protein J6590_023142 [Homalodisca vitripennis]
MREFSSICKHNHFLDLEGHNCQDVKILEVFTTAVLGPIRVLCLKFAIDNASVERITGFWTLTTIIANKRYNNFSRIGNYPLRQVQEVLIGQDVDGKKNTFT